MRKPFLLIPLLALAGPVSRAEDPKPGGDVIVDKTKRTVTVAAKVAPRKVLDQVYPIELVAGWPHPKGKKAHEIVIR